jgi:hypothetical protein
MKAVTVKTATTTIKQVTPTGKELVIKWLMTSKQK